MGKTTAKPLPMQTAIKIAAQAESDPRTVRAVHSGAPPKRAPSAVRLRVEAALRAAGLLAALLLAQACASEGVELGLAPGTGGTGDPSSRNTGTAAGVGGATWNTAGAGGQIGTGGASTISGTGGNQGDAGAPAGPEAGADAGRDGGIGDVGTDADGCASVPSAVVENLCNDLPFPAARVPFTEGTGPAPDFTGGTLVDGLYTAIKAEGWGTTSGRGRQMGIVISNGGKTLLWFGQTLNADGSGDVDAGTAGLGWLRANYDLAVVSGNTLGLTETCLAGTTSGPTRLLYTATSDPPRLILANVESPSASVTTYERQGCP